MLERLWGTKYLKILFIKSLSLYCLSYSSASNPTHKVQETLNSARNANVQVYASNLYDPVERGCYAKSVLVSVKR